MELRFIIIKVKDLQRAKEFYIKLLKQDPFKEEINRIIEFEFNGIRLALYNPLSDGHSLDKINTGNNCIPAFGVDNLKSELKRISNFAKIINNEKSGKHEWFEFEDTEGNIIEIHKK